MTNEQKAFLDANPEYRPIGQSGGNARWTERGTLKPDGTFVRATKKHPIDETKGAFAVGKLTMAPAGGGVMAPDDTRLMTKPGIPGLQRARRAAEDDEPLADEPPKDPRDYVTNWKDGGSGSLPSQANLKR